MSVILDLKMHAKELYQPPSSVDDKLDTFKKMVGLLNGLNSNEKKEYADIVAAEINRVTAITFTENGVNNSKTLRKGVMKIIKKDGDPILNQRFSKTFDI